MSNCLTDLIQELRDLRGVIPAYSGTDPADRSSYMYRSLNDVLQSLTDMRGVLNDGWFEDQYATIADVVQAMRGGDQGSASAMWSQLAALLGAGSSIASIASFVGNLLAAQEETVVEGGLMIAQIAATSSIAAMLQTMSLQQTAIYSQLIDVIKALRGTTAPEDNIMELLR